MNCVWSATRLSCFMNKGFVMPCSEEHVPLQSARQRELLDKRAAALRANLKRRKEQNAGRDDQALQDISQDNDLQTPEGKAL